MPVAKINAEFLVNTTVASDQSDAWLEALTDGRFVVSWTDGSATGGDTDRDAVRMRIFNADGSESTGQLLVNTSTTFIQNTSAISQLTDGRFVVVYTDFGPGLTTPNTSAIRARIFNNDGSASIVEFNVAAASLEAPNQPSVEIVAGRPLYRDLGCNTERR